MLYRCSEKFPKNELTAKVGCEFDGLVREATLLENPHIKSSLSRARTLLVSMLNTLSIHPSSKSTDK